MVKLSELTKPFYKTGEVAKYLNISVRGVEQQCDRGVIQNTRTDKNHRRISREELIRLLKKDGLLYEDDANRCDVIYARVSTHKQKSRGDLDRQIEAITLFTAFKEPKNLTVLSDVGSGLNDNRKGLNTLLQMVMEDKVNRIFISSPDRLTRFGFNYLKNVCDFHRTEIVVVASEEDDKSVEEELAQDIISIIHSFSGKLYGMRRKVKEDIDKELSD